MDDRVLTSFELSNPAAAFIIQATIRMYCVQLPNLNFESDNETFDGLPSLYALSLTRQSHLNYERRKSVRSDIICISRQQATYQK